MRTKYHTLFVTTTFGVAAISVWLILRTWTLVICPEWQVNVVDSHGGPVANEEVFQTWRFSGLEQEQYESRFTNRQGHVVFPPRYIMRRGAVIFLTRIIGFVGVHSSFGPRSGIVLRGRNNSINNYDYRIQRDKGRWIVNVAI